jgi:mRNA interferase MazF
MPQILFMTSYRPGDVLLVELKFSDGTGSKKRPVVVLSNDAYNAGRQNLMVMAVTSNTTRILYGDTKIIDWQDSGLKLPSLAAGIVQTITQDMVLKKIGVLSSKDFQKIQATLKETLNLSGA